MTIQQTQLHTFLAKARLAAAFLSVAAVRQSAQTGEAAATRRTQFFLAHTIRVLEDARSPLAAAEQQYLMQRATDIALLNGYPAPASCGSIAVYEEKTTASGGIGLPLSGNDVVVMVNGGMQTVQQAITYLYANGGPSVRFTHISGGTI